MPPGLNCIVVEKRDDYAAHLTAVTGLFEATFRRDFPGAIWNQYYFDNPYGDPIVSLAYSGSTLIAHQAFVPAMASDGSSCIRYHLSMSTMVHPAHRATLAFIKLFETGHRQVSAQGSAFVLGFPNANTHRLMGPFFGYKTIIESPLRNWTPPNVEPATMSADPDLGRLAGRFSPPSTAEYWTWRTKLNQARAVVVNDRLRIVYKLLAEGTLNVLNVEMMPRCGTARSDLAGLAAAEGCRNVRITEYHASMLGIAASELTSHEDYCVRMSALELCQPIPELQFNLLFCDVF